jgi:sarcosine oxidase subunit gamma
VLLAGEESLDGGGVEIGLFDVGDVRGLPKADELGLRDAFLDLKRAGLAELVAADGEERSLVALLADAIAGDGCVVDLSANRTGLELSGADARTVLATCCSLDLHPRVFATGQCAQTLVQKAGVLIEHRGEDRYLLLVRPSFAAYVAEWLLDGMLGLEADLITTSSSTTS